VKDSPEWNVSPEHAIHLLELAAILCEEYEGSPYQWFILSAFFAASRL
jgi:hypothetical protein